MFCSTDGATASSFAKPQDGAHRGHGKRGPVTDEGPTAPRHACQLQRRPFHRQSLLRGNRERALRVLARLSRSAYGSFLRVSARSGPILKGTPGRFPTFGNGRSSPQMPPLTCHTARLVPSTALPSYAYASARFASDGGGLVWPAYRRRDEERRRPPGGFRLACGASNKELGKIE